MVSVSVHSLTSSFQHADLQVGVPGIGCITLEAYMGGTVQELKIQLFWFLVYFLPYINLNNKKNQSQSIMGGCDN